MIQARNISVKYGPVWGLQNISLDIAEGETCCIIGTSGCGKTTLLHALAALVPLYSGSVDITRRKPGGLRIGLLQQRDALFPWLTVRANVELGLRGRAALPEKGYRRGSPEAAQQLENASPEAAQPPKAAPPKAAPPEAAQQPGRQEHITSLLEELGIGETAERYPGQLSGGQRQRAALARAMIHQPEILLLDEPSASLDAFGKEALQNLLLKVQQRHPVTTVCVTHDMEEALFLGNRILIMESGRIHASHVPPLQPHLEAREKPEFYREVQILRGLLREAAAL